MATGTPAKSTPAKATATKAVTENKNEETVTVTPDVKVEENNVSETPVVEEKKERITEVLSSNPILADFCKQYLDVVDEIADYNKAVLAERDSEWSTPKIMEKARQLGNPDSADVKPNETIKKALDAFEAAATEYSKARKAVLESTAKELGISLSATAERDSTIEAPLKEKRKVANELGNQLEMLAKMLTDAAISSAVTEFLEKNPLPAVGRDQARTFGTETKSTPKYRVTITVTDSDGNEKLKEDGFTKTALGLTKFYERGKAPKSDMLREAWEKAGNSPEKTVVSPVEFTDNNLHYSIAKK